MVGFYTEFLVRTLSRRGESNLGGGYVKYVLGRWFNEGTL